MRVVPIEEIIRPRQVPKCAKGALANVLRRDQPCPYGLASQDRDFFSSARPLNQLREPRSRFGNLVLGLCHPGLRPKFAQRILDYPRLMYK